MKVGGKRKDSFAVKVENLYAGLCCKVEPFKTLYLKKYFKSKHSFWLTVNFQW